MTYILKGERGAILTWLLKKGWSDERACKFALGDKKEIWAALTEHANGNSEYEYVGQLVEDVKEFYKVNPGPWTSPNLATR